MELEWIEDKGQRPFSSGVGKAVRDVTSPIYRALLPRATEGLLGMGGILQNASPFYRAQQEVEQNIKQKLPDYMQQENIIANPSLPLPSDIKRHITKPLEKAAGIPREFRKAEPGYEQFLDQLAQDAPMAIAMNVFAGVPFGQGLAQYGASSAAAKGAENVGLGETGQFVAGTLAGMKVGNLFRNPDTLRARGEKVKKAKYTESKDIAQSIGNVDAYNLLDNVLEVNDKITGLESSARTEVVKQLGEIEKRITTLNKRPVINLAEAQDLRTHFNTLARTTNNEVKKSYYNQFANLIRQDIINPAKSKHPAYGKVLNMADDLHIGLDGAKALQGLVNVTGKISSLAKAHPITATVLGGGSLVTPYISKVSPKALATVAGARAVAKKLSAAEFLYRSKEARKLLYDMSKDALVNDKALIQRNLVKFNHLVKEYEDKKFKDMGIEWIN